MHKVWNWLGFPIILRISTSVYGANINWNSYYLHCWRKMISLPCSLTRLYTVGWPNSNCHLDIPKTDNGQLQKQEVENTITEIQQVMGESNLTRE